MTRDAAIGALAALDDEFRRGMYWFIRHARRPVSRDEAADKVGISRKLAAFHLDKLVTAGLLRARYEQLGGIRRVGRSPKVYEPVDTDIRVSIPERRHEILADILTEALLTETADETGREAAIRVAGQRGTDRGNTLRQEIPPVRLATNRAFELLQSALTEQGFEPSQETPSCLRLRNCPFHPLAARAPDLVCGINHAYLTGLITGLHADSVTATLAPTAGECCVELRGNDSAAEPES